MVRCDCRADRYPYEGRNRWTMIVSAGVFAFIAMPASAQDISRIPSILEAFEIGRVLPLPPTTGQRVERSLACDMICSPFVPRQTIATVNWLDGEARRPRLGPSGAGLRLDIALASASFEAGSFGTLSIESVPQLEDLSAVAISPQIRQPERPSIAFQRVEDNRIVARPRALPSPEILLRERIPGAMDRIDAQALTAMEVDLLDGGLGRMQAVAQVVDSRQGEQVRALVIEGLQPGVTYRLRLVAEGPERAEAVDGGICRVPVCPADFAN